MTEARSAGRSKPYTCGTQMTEPIRMDNSDSFMGSNLSTNDPL